MIPSKLISGDSAVWLDAPVVDNAGHTYDSTGYTLTYYLRGPATADITATANGSGWKTTLTTTISATLTPGTYAWAAVASRSGEKVTLASGELVIAANLSAQAAGFDPRTPEEIALRNLQDAYYMATTGNSKVLRYKIGDREVQYQSLADMREAIQLLKVTVRNQRRAQAIANGDADPINVHARLFRS